MKNIFYYDTVIGRLKIAENGQEITEIQLIKDGINCPTNETPLIKKACQELAEYFAGKRKVFDLPLKLEGTEFQKRVWQALMGIPYGETRSYKQIAKAVGCPKGCRAVGNANNKNKILIVVPCHRVMGANGGLVGFGAGIDAKMKLLQIENKKYIA
ncbi:MAG: methylated-DNA--[protein]-cysteine S-methyltransferase [Firmicutes bacterium]|nr:methylated-DNA--[protein]-cysteine S-methyltransferase [Bacillota bacterium]